MSATFTAPNATDQDALNQAMTATGRDRHYFGQVQTDWYFCVLQKGAGKVLFDPQQHSADQRRVAITISLAPLPSDRVPTPQAIERSMVDFERDWTRYTLPSLKALGLDLNGVRGQWAQVKLTKTSEYTSSDGTVKDRTAIVFVAVYPDQAACVAARDAMFTRHDGPSDTAPAATVASPAQASVPATVPQQLTPRVPRSTAAMLLPSLWTATGHDIDAFMARIQSIPDLAAHFDKTSPEIVKLTGGEPL